MRRAESTTAATVAGGPVLAANPGTVGRAIPTVGIDIRGGENVYPAEVEQVLECAVFGADHADLGQEVAAVVVHQEPVEAGELADFARRRLAYYKVPTSWRLTVEALPRTAAGKVIRGDLGSWRDLAPGPTLAAE